MEALLLNMEWDLGHMDYQDMVIAHSAYPKEPDKIVEKEQYDTNNSKFKQRYIAINFMAILSYHVHNLGLESVDPPKKMKTLLQGTKND